MRYLTLAVLAPSAAMAHPGDHSHEGPLHILTSADHLAVFAALAAVAGLILWRRARR